MNRIKCVSRKESKSGKAKALDISYLSEMIFRDNILLSFYTNVEKDNLVCNQYFMVMVKDGIMEIPLNNKDVLEQINGDLLRNVRKDDNIVLVLDKFYHVWATIQPHMILSFMQTLGVDIKSIIE